MDGSMFRDLYKGLFWAAVVGAVLIAGGAFGAGYLLRGCDGHPSIRWVRTKPEASDAAR